jgi:hypothetical protein
MITVFKFASSLATVTVTGPGHWLALSGRWRSSVRKTLSHSVSVLSTEPKNENLFFWFSRPATGSGSALTLGPARAAGPAGPWSNRITIMDSEDTPRSRSGRPRNVPNFACMANRGAYIDSHDRSTKTPARSSPCGPDIDQGLVGLKG